MFNITMILNRLFSRYCFFLSFESLFSASVLPPQHRTVIFAVFRQAVPP